jgi:hypothetical protein
MWREGHRSLIVEVGTETGLANHEWWRNWNSSAERRNGAVIAWHQS